MGDPSNVSEDHNDFLRTLFSEDYVRFANEETEKVNLDPIEKEKLYAFEKSFYTNESDPDGRTPKQKLASLKKSTTINDHRLASAFEQRRTILTRGYGTVEFDPSISQYIPDEPGTPGGRKRKTRRRRNTRRRKTLGKKK